MPPEARETEVALACLAAIGPAAEPAPLGDQVPKRPAAAIISASAGPLTAIGALRVLVLLLLLENKTCLLSGA
jgi:hypothetical protein